MKLLWTDCETTDLEPHKGFILEVAAATARLENPFRLSPIQRWVLPFPAQAYWDADPKVQAMHTANGLWEQCRTSTTRLHDVENALLEMVALDEEDKRHDFAWPTDDEPHPDKLCTICEEPYGSVARGADGAVGSCPVAKRRNMTTLAGSTVHFDLGFFRVHMPRLAASVYSRTYDVSAVKLFCRSMGMGRLVPGEAHRATEDLLESVAHVLECVKWLGQRALFEKKVTK